MLFVGRRLGIEIFVCVLSPWEQVPVHSLLVTVQQPLGLLVVAQVLLEGFNSKKLALRTRASVVRT